MTALSPATENKILFLGLGITTCAILGLMRHMLIVYRDSVEVKKSTPITQYITQGTEDSLKIRTLEKLIESHNYGIHETASRIVCDRALHDSATLNALLWELTRPDRDRREQAIRAIYMLTEQPGMVELNKPIVYNAIVACLEHCVQDVPHNSYDKDFDNYYFRDPVERISLFVLVRLSSEFGTRDMIKAGIVPKWVAKEPWGNSEKEVFENFKHLCSQLQGVLKALVMNICQDTRGLEQLVRAKLIDPTDHVFSPRSLESLLEEEKSNHQVLSDVVPVEGGPRLREQSAEERHLRRRHREAMVLNDGVQPIGVSDIIEREYESPTEERQ